MSRKFASHSAYPTRQYTTVASAWCAKGARDPRCASSSLAASSSFVAFERRPGTGRVARSAGADGGPSHARAARAWPRVRTWPPHGVRSPRALPECARGRRDVAQKCKNRQNNVYGRARRFGRPRPRGKRTKTLLGTVSRTRHPARMSPASDPRRGAAQAPASAPESRGPRAGREVAAAAGAVALLAVGFAAVSRPKRPSSLLPPASARRGDRADSAGRRHRVRGGRAGRRGGARVARRARGRARRADAGRAAHGRARTRGARERKRTARS